MLGPQGPARSSHEPTAAAMLKAKTCSDQSLCFTCQGVLEDQVIPERQSMVPKVELGTAHTRTIPCRAPCPLATVEMAQSCLGAWALRASGDSRMAFGRCCQPR